MSQAKKFESVADEGPPKKKVRLCPRAAPSEREPKARKCKKVAKTTPLNLCSLPTEILEKIIGNINIWHHNRIRGTCRRLQHVNDVFVMHQFQKAIQKHIRQDANSEASAALRVIKLSTEVFVQSGFESVFCGCILPMLRCCYRDPFCPNFLQIRKFLVHFYGMIANLMGETASQRWRLLYTMTLLHLIKAFDKTILSSSIKPLHWRIVVKLKGPWIGTLWSPRSRALNQSRNRSNLLVIFAEILIANITEKGFKHLWECPSEVYIFGNDTSKSNRVAITLLTFTVCGSKKICNLLRACLEECPESIQDASKLPNDQFTINLDVICKEAMKWGCSKSQHMELGPFSDKFYEDDEEDTSETNYSSESL